MSHKATIEKFEAGHEEKFRDDGSFAEILKADNGPRRFKCVAYTGVDVGRSFGRMVINSHGIKRAQKMGMLLEHDDMIGVAVCDHHEVYDDGRVILEGYFLDEKASPEAPRLIAKMDQGWPMKMSVGIRFSRTSFLEEGAKATINGREFSGPLYVVDECTLFETSFIHVNPADLATEAALMRREQQMADAAKAEDKPQVATLDEKTRNELLAEGERRAMERIESEQKLEAALHQAFPGKGEKAQAKRAQARQDKLTLEQVKDIALKRTQNRLAKFEKRAQDEAAAVENLKGRFEHAGAGFDASKAAIVEDRGETNRFESLKFEDRVYAELRSKPQLMEIFRGGRDAPDAKQILTAWLKSKDVRCTRDGERPVLCDLRASHGDARVSPTTLKALEQMADDVLKGFQAQRLDVGSVGPDLARITINGFQGQFYVGYEEELSKNWSMELSFQIPSDQNVEIVRWLSAPPMIQEWKGSRIAKELKIYEQLLKAVKFEGTLDISRWDWDHQKWDLIAKSFGLFGAVASQHWDIRFTQLIEANPTAYDGFSLFSNTHTLGGESGTIINDYSKDGSNNTGTAGKLGVNDPSMPTPLEWANIILQLTPKFRSFAWANGIKMHGTARQWGIMCHPDFEGNLQAAVSMERLDLGASNPLYSQRSQYKVIPNAYLTNKSYIYIFRLDTQNKALLRAEPDPIEMQWMGPGSHVAFEQDKYQMGLRCVRSIAPGAFESVLRAKVG